MKIKMKIAVAGTFHGIPSGVKPGDVIDVDDTIGARYCQLHYAEPMVDRKEERTVVTPEVEVRSEPQPETPEPPEQRDKPRSAAQSAGPRPGPRSQR